MFRFYFLLIIFFSTSVCSGQENVLLPVQNFITVPAISIRALEAVSDSKVWFAANHGVWGFTEDAGKTWHIDSIKVDPVFPEFRSMTVLNDSTVLLLSVASPAYLFKTTNKGKTWRVVYKNTDKDIFFDSMRFRDEKNGIAIADPIDHCFQVITTNDGGETWKQADCTNIPRAMEGEALFAASNTCIDSYKNHVWFVTGGKYARVFHAADSEDHFNVSTTPLIQGGKMTGVFSFDFMDNKTGIIAGGNYEKTDSSIVSLAITHDGGKTWKPLKSKKPFFGSCVQFRSADTFFVTGHDGTFIYNEKEISEMKSKEGAELKYHTLRISPFGKTIWLAGDKGRIAFITFAP